jgi:hypothetical protein
VCEAAAEAYSSNKHYYHQTDCAKLQLKCTLVTLLP